MRIEPLITVGRCLYAESVASTDDLTTLILPRIQDLSPELPREELQQAIEGSLGAGAVTTEGPVGFPLVCLRGLEELALAVALVRDGVELGEDRAPCELVFFLVAPPEAGWRQLRLLARLLRMCRGPGALERLRGTTDEADLYARVCREDARYG